MRKLLTEFIGTFFLVFTVGMTVINPGIGALAPLAIGMVITVMVYAGGHISGSHFNPVVTLVVWERKKIRTGLAVGYIAFQLLGAIAAAAVTLSLKGTPSAVPVNANCIPGIIAEIIGTFALIYVVLNTAMAKDNMGNPTYGIAIGTTITVMAFALGNVSAVAFNPAVALGISAMGLQEWNSLWFYLVGEMAGTVLAVAAFRYTSPKDK